MGSIVLSEFISLDGVIESPENWHFPYIDDATQAEIAASILGLDALLYGRVTYEVFAGYWPTAEDDNEGIAAKLNSTPKFVVSSTLTRADWHNTTILKGEAVEAVRALKQRQQGRIGLSGSATLARALMRAGLIDEYLLFLHPVVVGKGLRLFEEGIDLGLELADLKRFSKGVLLLTYRPAPAAA